VHFIPLRSTSARELADAFVKEIWRLHGLPLDITSDRDTRFTSHFWSAVMRKLDIKLNMSTAFHPQTDGQSEILNQILEQFLRIFCSYHQDDWVELLPFAEFSYNNSENASTKMTPFFAVYGQHPRSIWPSVQDKCIAGNEFVDRLEKGREELRSTLSEARERMRKHYDKKRKQQPDFQVGDKVLLNAKNIATLRPSKKLDHRMRGAWTITKKVGPRAFKLDLKGYKGRKHDVFPVNLLEPYHESTIPGRAEPPPPPVNDEGDEWDLEDVFDSKVDNRQVLYMVKWKGYGPDETTWEPWSNMTSKFAKDKVRDFHRRYPDKPRAPGCKL
jgi:Chromo (CHRromatin Organisation MOdifier) domain